uniref:Unconventional myosin-VI n=1 Tax=Steinernema glaseri TaxID=37863 RepID=A0A1I8AD67_9BILA
MAARNDKSLTSSYLFIITNVAVVRTKLEIRSLRGGFARKKGRQVARCAWFLFKDSRFQEMPANAEEFGKIVWAPDDREGYVLGQIVDLGTEQVTVKPLKGDTQIRARYDSVFPAEDDLRKDVDDNCALMYLNEGTLLNNCRIRYARRQIYTYVANILISINPYESIPDLYSQKTIRKYQGKSLGTLPPHIFAIADKAYRDMKRLRESQSVIVSGESGAGKTESQKCILRYLCENWGSAAGNIEKSILETNPILEAFGNAKTLRNNNSSRFGKFVEIHFGPKLNVAGGFVSHYLLEKSRICHQQAGERNYHVFYQLIAGADEQTRKRLKLRGPDHFQYLKSGCTQFFASSSSRRGVPPSALSPECKSKGFLEDSMVDDFADFQRLSKALEDLGIPRSQVDSIFDTIAALLHLGNVRFVENTEDSRGGCVLDPAATESSSVAAQLLGLDDYELRHGLVSRMMQPTKGGVKGTMIMVPLKVHEANAARDALAKAIYSRLFDFIVASINRRIPFGDSQSYIGVLDIAGFEFFAVNSFEQFCINYCNEKLQQFFNDRILKQEQELYAKEGLNVPKIEYSDNQDCIDLFEMRPMGLLDMLDEESKLPRPTPQHFTGAVHQTHAKHFRLTSEKPSKKIIVDAAEVETPRAPRDAR